jgi:hypothetical protein
MRKVLQGDHSAAMDGRALPGSHGLYVFWRGPGLRGGQSVMQVNAAPTEM